MVSSDSKAQRMHDHFSQVATAYNVIRTTDPEPVLYIKNKLKNRQTLCATDIGCGGGRYSLLLFQHLPGLHLTCNDVNASMVAEAARYLKTHGVKHFSVVRADISDLRLQDGSMDCILTFNAIHHFDAVVFLTKVARALRQHGYVFIYTRLKNQNARNIWGQFFPDFSEKETRLPDLAQVQSWIDSQTAVTLDDIEFFRFRRTSALRQLVHQAENKHYSTFSLYATDEFKLALQQFKKNIKQHFADPDRIEWFDENVMIVFRRD